MIDKIKKLYPNYLIIVKRNNRLFYINNEEICDKTILKDNNYIIIDDTSYEVHKKMRP